VWCVPDYATPLSPPGGWDESFGARRVGDGGAHPGMSRTLSAAVRLVARINNWKRGEGENGKENWTINGLNNWENNMGKE
jgi:hypothetical protein